MKCYGVVYKITNKINGKCYIGQTIHHSNPEKRIKKHFIFYSDKSYNLVINTAINKYGKENFDYEILVSAFSKDDLNYLEEYLITKNKSFGKNGYNVRPGGNSSRLAEETKKKISLKKMGQVGFFKGKKFSKEHCDSLSKVRKGFTSQARREAQAISIRKIFVPVEAINIKTGETLVFESIKSCAESLNLGACNVSRVLNGKQNRSQHKGWKFRLLS